MNILSLKKCLFLLTAGIGMTMGLTACGSDDDERETSPEPSYSAKIFLKNDKGQETTTFKEGENIIFCITLQNHANKSLEYSTDELFSLRDYDGSSKKKAIDVSEMAKTFEFYERLTAFAIYDAEDHFVAFPMEKISRQEISAEANGSVSFECPWFNKDGENVYNNIFIKEQQRTALPAGQYTVYNSYFYMPRGLKKQQLQFNIEK